MKKAVILLLIFSLLAVPVSAQQAPVEIRTPQELLAIADDPGGSYILMADIDMAGVSWPCPAFSGTLDGNGFAILNLTVTAPGETAKTAYDGNYKPYESRFAGLFSVAENAKIKNLTLLGMKALVTTDSPCFLGAIAGYAANTTVSACTVEATLELRAHNGMFGVAGLVGYGSGLAENCNVDVTLICTDTGKDTKDEQFMGGILASGFMDVKKCGVKLDAYSSEYGYAHNGGIVGMYYQRPFDREHYGKVIHNRVEGKITFFECNDDRRAYCKAEVGEMVATYFGVDYNTTNFTRDERKVYDQELRPEMCSAPAYASTVQAPTCEALGYTQHACTGCGYTYRDAYTLKSHAYGSWEVVTQPTAQASGQSKAVCGVCGNTAYREDAYLPPETTPEPTAPEPQATQPDPTQPAAPQPKDEGGTDWILIALAAVILAASAAVIYLMWQERQRKRRRKRRRPN